MSKEYKWEIENLKVSKSSDGLSNVIKKIYYRRTLKQIVNDIEYEVNYFGEFNLPPANPADFTEYENLTKEQIFIWLDSILPVEFINSRLNDYMVKKLEKDEVNLETLSNNLLK